MHVTGAPLRRAVRPTNRCALLRACWSVLLLILLTSGGLNDEAFGQSQALTVRWDPVSGDVGGYIVYLGSVPGSFDFSTDVRRETSYTVPGIEIGRAIYVSVAAYSSTGVIGPRTPDLFFDGRSFVDPLPGNTTGGALPCAAARAPCPRPAVVSSQSALATLSAQTPPCVTSGAGICYTTHMVGMGDGTVAGLIPLPDGTVLIAERAGRVFVHAGTMATPSLALEADPDRGDIHAAMPAADFESSGHIYVLSSRPRPLALRELQLTRFRLHNQRLLTPERLLCGITIREAAHPLLSSDLAGRIYVGIAKGTGMSPNDGVVLRLEPDEQVRSREPARQAVFTDRLGGSFGITLDHEVLLSLEASSSGWMLRQLGPGRDDVLYGLFPGAVTGLSPTLPPNRSSTLVYSQLGRSVTEVRVTDRTLTLGDRLVFDGPVLFAAGNLAEGPWVVVGADDGIDGYRVFKLRKAK